MSTSQPSSRQGSSGALGDGEVRPSPSRWRGSALALRCSREQILENTDEQKKDEEEGKGKGEARWCPEVTLSHLYKPLVFFTHAYLCVKQSCISMSK